jgi:hypothetical protein
MLEYSVRTNRTEAALGVSNAEMLSLIARTERGLG